LIGLSENFISWKEELEKYIEMDVARKWINGYSEILLAAKVMSLALKWSLYSLKIRMEYWRLGHYSLTNPISDSLPCIVNIWFYGTYNITDHPIKT
jgi:hypothetical protein